MRYENDVVIEPGHAYFEGPDRPKCYFRLGFSSIQLHEIEPGVIALGEVMRGMPAFREEKAQAAAG